MVVDGEGIQAVMSESIGRVTMIMGANGQPCRCRICKEPDPMSEEWLPTGVSGRLGFDWEGTYLATRYANAKQNARKRGYDWDISRSEFLVFARGNCYYCGAEPKPIFETHPVKSKNSKNGIAIVTRTTGYSSLDRIDNSKGYSMDNVVSCCMPCNSGKTDGTLDEYVKRCIRVAAKHGRRYET